MHADEMLDEGEGSQALLPKNRQNLRAGSRRAVAAVMLFALIALVAIVAFLSLGSEAISAIADTTRLLLLPTAAALLLLGIALYVQEYVRIAFQSLRENSHRRLVSATEYVVLYFLFFLVFIDILLVFRYLIPEAGEPVWQFLAPRLPYGVIAIVVALLFVVAGEMVDWLGQKWKMSSEEPGAVSVIDFAVLVGRYLVYGIGLFVIVLIELSLAGLTSLVLNQIGSFLSSNYQFILFIGVFVLLSWFGYRMVSDYIETVHAEHRRAHPELYRLEVTAVRYVFALVVFTVVSFSLLRMAGLEAVGLIIVSVSLVIAVIGILVASSSRPGNIVAGFMLINEKPFDVGDRILVDGREGTVHDIGRVYTEMRTADGSVLTIPNSLLLNKSIENLSRAKRRLASVDFFADADVPVARIREAAAAAASGAPGVEKIETTVVGLRGRQLEYRVTVTTTLEAKPEEATASVLQELARMVASGEIGLATQSRPARLPAAAGEDERDAVL